MVTLSQLRQAAQRLGLSAKPLCVHASLSSFGTVEGGAATLAQALLDEGCTLMVPTFSWSFAVRPPRSDRPQRNGLDYEQAKFGLESGTPFTVDSTVCDADMGALPAAVLAMPQRVRGRSGVCSFSAVGPLARELIDKQSPLNVYAPLRAVAMLGGLVVLMGVDLRKMTMLHLAEQQAGRRLFVRWANGPGRSPMASHTGGCSDGFNHLAPFLAPVEKRASVGKSVWRVFPAVGLIRHAVDAIRLNPNLTHCNDPRCLRCNDAVAGGPLTADGATGTP